MVWDTAGQEEFDAITRTYYRGDDMLQQCMHANFIVLHTTVTQTASAGAGAAVLVFSTTDQASFHAVTRWKNKVQKHSCHKALPSLDLSRLRRLFPYMQIEAESGPIPMALVQNKVDLMDQVRKYQMDRQLPYGGQLKACSHDRLSPLYACIVKPAF